MMKMITIGGRVKAASIGLGNLFRCQGVVETEKAIKQLRKFPSVDLLNAFFPADQFRIKQLLNGIGFFRPMIKTDQGMGGNFLPFYVDEEMEKTEFAKRTIIKEEGVAIPESYCQLNIDIVKDIQRMFHQFKLRETAEILENLSFNGRQAEKGRGVFFFIRPAKTDQKIVFGQDVVKMVTRKTNEFLQNIIQQANEIEKRHCGFTRPDNLIYCQPDVFILADGTIIIEKINCPDVGLFLRQLENPYSSILEEIQSLMGRMQWQLYRKISDVLADKEIALVTRDEVLRNHEDILEQKELLDLTQGLGLEGKNIKVYPVSLVRDIPVGRNVILLNLNYQAKGISSLIERHCKGELNLFPNPFFQMVCNQLSGLREVIVDDRYHSNFFRIAGSQPKSDQSLELIWNQLASVLTKKGVESDILHIDIGSETVPVFRKSMHSWRQLVRRIKRYDGLVQIKIRPLPVTKENLLIDSTTGPRLHAFRFLFTCG